MRVEIEDLESLLGPEVSEVDLVKIWKDDENIVKLNVGRHDMVKRVDRNGEGLLCARGVLVMRDRKGTQTDEVLQAGEDGHERICKDVKTNPGHFLPPPLPPPLPFVADCGLQFGGRPGAGLSLDTARWLPRHPSHLWLLPRGHASVHPPSLWLHEKHNGFPLPSSKKRPSGR